MAALALLTQSLSSIDLIVENRASLLAFLKITSLSLPQLFSIVLPFAVFVAVGYSVQRLQTDNEFTVAYAGGMTQWQVISPILRTVSYAVLINLLINLFVQPIAFRSMRETIYEVRSDLATAIVRPGKFVSPALNLTIFARELNNGVMKDVFIYDGRDQERPVTFLAKTGVFTDVTNRPSITLNDASQQTLTPEGNLEILNSSSTSFELNGVIEPQGDLLYKYSDRYISELFNPDPTDYWEMTHKADLKAEGHYRLASPLYNFTLCLLALVALLGGDYNKFGYGRRLALFGVLALVVRLIGFSTQAAASDNSDLNFLQYLVPLSVSFLALWLLFRKKASIAHRPPVEAG
jgi:lipopolysaccharide export system permease protein